MCRNVGAAYLVLAVAFWPPAASPTTWPGCFQSCWPPARAGRAGDTGRPRLRRGLLVAAFALSIAELPIMLPVLPESVVHYTPLVALNYDAGETIGWPAYVRQIATVYRFAPASQRASATVLARTTARQAR